MHSRISTNQIALLSKARVDNGVYVCAGSIEVQLSTREREREREFCNISLSGKQFGILINGACKEGEKRLTRDDNTKTFGCRIVFFFSGYN